MPSSMATPVAVTYLSRASTKATMLLEKINPPVAIAGPANL